jgi:hypothetical protein
MKLRLTLAILTFIGCCGDAALAQSGVSNQRDMYGNVVRDGSAYQPRGVNQGPTNNGLINSAPTQPPAGNSRPKPKPLGQ